MVIEIDMNMVMSRLYVCMGVKNFCVYGHLFFLMYSPATLLNLEILAPKFN